MSIAHTPGPWTFYTEPQPNGCPIVGARGLMVAMLAHTVNQSDQKETALANALLIAAAPDLLAALQELTDDIADRFDMDSPSTNPGMKTAVREARAALVKATGAAS